MYQISLATCGPLGGALRSHRQSMPFYISINGEIRHIEVATIGENNGAVILDLQEATPAERVSHEDEPDPAVEVTAEQEAAAAALEGGDADPAPTTSAPS